MSAINFYFQVHQPWRIKKYRVFDIGRDHDYFTDNSDTARNNKKVFEKVTQKCYLPTNKIFQDLLDKYPHFKISYSLSGVFLEQAEKFAPEVIKSFQKLVQTNRVEILAETYYHSLSFLYSKDEFDRQVLLHRKKIRDLFGVTPKVFRNTELIYSNELGRYLEDKKYLGVLAEGADHILGWRSPNFLYRPPGTAKIKLLLKNYNLSDDIAFRFSSKDWKEYPLTAEKFAGWVNQVNGNGDLINLFMDYETFGEHQWEDTGIFNFLKSLPREICRHPDNYFVTPTEAVKMFPARDEIDVPHFISWADVERDLSAWLGNDIQKDAVAQIYSLEKAILKSKDKKLIDDWRKLQTSDHFYYMCTKWFADGDVHKYFNPYESPYEAFISFMNVLTDLRLRIPDYVINNPT